MREGNIQCMRQYFMTLQATSRCSNRTIVSSEGWTTNVLSAPSRSTRQTTCWPADCAGANTPFVCGATEESQRMQERMAALRSVPTAALRMIWRGLPKKEQPSTRSSEFPHGCFVYAKLAPHLHQLTHLLLQLSILKITCVAISTLCGLI